MGGFFHLARFREPLLLKSKFKNFGHPPLIANAKFIFDNDVFLNRHTNVSDNGLSALGTALKELKSLTNLSLNFQYFYL